MCSEIAAANSEMNNNVLTNFELQLQQKPFLIPEPQPDFSNTSDSRSDLQDHQESMLRIDNTTKENNGVKFEQSTMCDNLTPL